MAVSLRFIPGGTIRWREWRFVVVDYTGMDALVAREVWKRRLQRIPVNEAVTDLISGDRDAWTPDFGVRAGRSLANSRETIQNTEASLRDRSH